MVTADSQPDDSVLVAAGPGEHIAYGRTVTDVTSVETLTLSPEADHEIVVALAGSGYVRWDGLDHAVSSETQVLIPRGVTYTLRSDSTETLAVMIYGIEEQR